MTTGPLPAGAEPGDRSGSAGDVVGGVLRLAEALRHHQEAGVAELGLTPAVARALAELDPEHPLPARELADQLGCDRSNVTGLVDKLEQAGLVERRVDPTDRRQKTLVVTAAGRRMRDRVRAVLTDSRLLGGLRPDELAALGELVGKVTDDAGPPRCG